MNKILKEDQEKLKFFKKLGYDIPEARSFVLLKADLSGKILEVGTGRGHLATALAKKGLKVVSIDKDPKQQKIARAALKARGLVKPVVLKLMDAENLAYEDCFFDGVISVNFLHHARDPVRCVQEMIRVTNSKLVLADLNKKGERIMEGMHKSQGHGHPRSGLSFESLKRFLSKSGMRVKTYRHGCETVLIASKSK